MRAASDTLKGLERRQASSTQRAPSCRRNSPAALRTVKMRLAVEADKPQLCPDQVQMSRNRRPLIDPSLIRRRISALNNPQRPLRLRVLRSADHPVTGKRVVYDDCRDQRWNNDRGERAPGVAKMLRSICCYNEVFACAMGRPSCTASRSQCRSRTSDWFLRGTLEAAIAAQKLFSNSLLGCKKLKFSTCRRW